MMAVAPAAFGGGIRCIVGFFHDVVGAAGEHWGKQGCRSGSMTTGGNSSPGSGLLSKLMHRQAPPVGTRVGDP